VARGYYNRAELTDARFMDDPFRPGGRMYDTGDNARYMSDGTIEFLGRLDNQVKVRGYRIETGEIEAALKLHPQMVDCLVLARPNQVGINQLIAYVITSDGVSEVREWRSFLKEKLPDYMIPAYFIPMETFPETPNKKIDRKRLPDPDYVRPDTGSEYIQPQSVMEKKLAAIWGEVLGIPTIGIHDNFFDLGGNSLLVVQIQNRLGKELAGRDIQVVELFQYPTIASLAAALTGEAVDDPTVAAEHVRQRKEKEGKMSSRREQRKLIRN
jgi:hypothetical protein